MKRTKKESVIFAILVALILSVIHTSCASSSEVDPIKQQLSFVFLRDVSGLDVSKYAINRSSSFVDSSSVYYTVYHLSSVGSELEIGCNFRNNELIWCHIYTISGSPTLTQHAADSLNAAKGFLHKYRDFSKAVQVPEMQYMLNAVSELKASTVTAGNTKLTIRLLDNEYVDFNWMNTANGIKNIYNRAGFLLRNGVFVQFFDNWNQYRVGNTDVKFARDQALSLAKERVESFSYEMGTGKLAYNVSGLEVSGYPPFAELSMQPRADGALYPHWEVYLPLTHVYPGNVASVAVNMWADTGEIDNIYAMSTLGDVSSDSPQVSAIPSAAPVEISLPPYSPPTPTETPSASPSAEPTPSPSPTLQFSPSPPPQPSDITQRSDASFAVAVGIAVTLAATVAVSVLVLKRKAHR